MSRLHISVSDFYQMTPIEFQYALNDFNGIEEEKRKIVFESMRLQTMHIHNINPNTKNKMKNVKIFMPFEWDRQKKQTVEEMKALLFSFTKAMGGTINKKSK